MTKNKILSIQSRLIYGYVGGNIAELAIQLHGLEVISFPTVLLSAHTGHKPIHGKAIDKELFDELIIGIEEIDVIREVSCIISGYIGTEDIILSTSDFIQKIKKNYSDKLYICDPVMGDVDTGLYVSEKLAEKLINTLIPHCDIVTPNHFELEYILNHKIRMIDELVGLVNDNSLLNKKILIVTSCHLEDTPKGKLETIIVKEGKAERIFSQKIDIDTVGTGDLFTAILASQLILNKNFTSAVTIASKTVGNALSFIVQKGLIEMDAECLLKYIPYAMKQDR